MTVTSNSLRSFAGGILIATSLIGAVYLFGPSEASSTGKEEPAEVQKLTEDEMVKKLTSKGYVIHTEDQWNKQLKAMNENQEEKASDKKDDGKVVYKTMLTVSTGMTSIDVGNALEQANIIKDGLDFYKEVEKRGLENELRPGTFDVESGMTTDEIISAIFK
ncbi:MULTISPECIES: endolytic transglycosylase MltG [Rossellomorea]|uniref:endolytic transglycosylase MltG n=1 Tax=Rossellomorea TaxID=2837508 RepID=UPI001CCA5696|nr:MULTISPECIES: endolytic transglycosylase MltG [Rossellomorea]MCA0149115.1 endolytic transglycosylase MltG [Rossellomorea vietnamensis]UTE78999.1 endolytic transglycosylase MltG [Rossellomorea sp. KS-H15a]WGG47061.1 endolytic transglycosylase MltG [Rossellomorea sp. DA94]